MKKIHVRRILALLLITSAAGGVVWPRVKQYLFKRRVERLLLDLRSLEVQKSSAEQAATIARRDGFEGSCFRKDCYYFLETASPSAHILSRFYKLIRRPYAAPSAAALSALTMLAGQPAMVRASIEVRQNRVSSEYFLILVGNGPIVSGGVDIDSLKPPMSRSQPPAANLSDALWHGGYRVGRQDSSAGSDWGPFPVTMIWTELDANIAREDKSRLMQFDMDCLTRWHLCPQQDLTPAAWAQYSKDEHERALPPDPQLGSAKGR